MKKVMVIFLFSGTLLSSYLYYSSKKNYPLSNKIIAEVKNKNLKSASYKKIESIREKIKSTSIAVEHDQESVKKLNQAMRSFGKNEYEKLLRESLLEDPNNVEALGRLSEHMLGKNLKEESRELAIECIARDPKNDLCHRSLISSFTRHGEFEESYNYLKDCLAEVPDNIHCNAGMFTYNLTNKNIQEAEENLEEMIKNSPHSLWTIIAQADMAFYKGNSSLAYQMFSQACTMNNAYACQRKKEIKL